MQTKNYPKKNGFMQFLSLILALVLTINLFPTVANAEDLMTLTPAEVGDTITFTTTYSARSGAGTNYGRLEYVRENQSFEVLEVIKGGTYNLFSTGGELYYTGNTWYKIRVNGKNAYVCADPHNKITKKQTTTTTTQTPTTATSTQAPTPTTTQKPYVPGGNNDGPAYTNAEWQEVLNQFPESYHYYLNDMHEKYPAWRFVPAKHDYTLEYAVNLQRQNPARNTVNRTGHSNAYRDMTQTQQMDAGGWYAASDEAVAYAMDPRNWLNEKYVFMFEMQSYDPNAPGRATLERMFEGNQDLLNMIPGILSAAAEQDVSPVFIGARILMEVSITSGGVKTVTAPAKGTLKVAQSTLDALGDPSFNPDLSKNYYNVFNIGAYDGTNPQQNGVLYAMGYGVSAATKAAYNLPWDTQEKAISGGTKFIAQSYINAGQNTNYYMKYNMNWPKSQLSGKIWHQYMTNAFAPVQEASTQYNSYSKIGALNDGFTFLIPVYEDMTATPYRNPGTMYFDNAVRDNPYVDYEDLSDFNLGPASPYANVGDTIRFDANYNYRSAPNTTNGAVLGSFKAGTSVKVESRVTGQAVSGYTNQWYAISHGGRTVYVIANPAQQPITERASSETTPPTPTPPTPTPTTTTIPTTRPTEPAIMKGDVSGDGKISLIDMSYVEMHIRGQRTLTGNNLKAADVSGDGNVSLIDMSYIEMHIRGQRPIE